MKSMLRSIALAVSFALLPAPQTFGVALDYGPDQSLFYPESWPSRLVDLANLPNRVGGHFVDQDDSLAFRGDTSAFRAFLDGCTSLAGAASTTLFVHDGNGLFQPQDESRSAIPCDWRLDVINLHARATGLGSNGPMYALELHVWLGGSVNVAAIHVPAIVKTVKE